MMRTRGFTLTEFIIYVFIVGVIGGIALPVYKDYRIKLDELSKDSLVIDVNPLEVSCHSRGMSYVDDYSACVDSNGTLYNPIVQGSK